MDILDQIIDSKHLEVTANKKKLPLEQLIKQCENSRKCISFKEALTSSKTGIIAEFKRKSPSKNNINLQAKVSKVVDGYVKNGATAISVLTDDIYFGGSLEDLCEARMTIDKSGKQIPILRKDFVIDAYQVYEAKANGADVILLIAAVLSPDKVKSLAELAHKIGLEVLLEIHEESEIGHLNEFIDVVGVNNRNLSTFVTDIKTSFDLGDLLPHGTIKISESGIHEPETVRTMQHGGLQGFLIGEAFMVNEDPGLALGEFIEKVLRKGV